MAFQANPTVFGKNREKNRIEFIKTTLAPELYQVLPPNIHNVTTISKEVSIYGNFTVNDSALVAPFIPTSSGVIAWHVTRDASSIHRFGKVPANSFIFAFNGVGEAPPSLSLSTTYDTWIQYGPADDVTVSPDLGTNFTFVRPFAGVIECYSSTVSSTNVALSGTMCAASLQDTRDVWQTTATATGSLSQTNLAQSCVTHKDALLNVPLYDGITTVQGSDIPIDFRIPDAGLVSHRDGPSAVFALPNILPTSVNPIRSLLNVPGGNFWFSPLGITAAGGIPTYAIPYIGVYGQMEYTVSFDVAFATPNTAYPVNMYVTWSDMYAQATTAGSVTGNVANFDTQTISMICPASTFDNVRGCRVVHTSAPPSFGQAAFGTLPANTGGAPVGTYVGSFLQFTAMGTVVASESPLLTNVQVSARALGLYAPGELGPVRIMRWDNAGLNQTVSVSGRLLVECVPRGQLAPYVTPSQLTDSMSYSVNLFPFASYLYNGKSLFKRNWVRSQYRKLLDQALPRFSAENITSWTEEPEEMLEVAHAAGLFSGLGSALGNIAGGLLGQSQFGQQLGGLVGGLGDRLLGQSSGVYGDAAGVYGMSTGQYQQCLANKRMRSDMGA